MHTLIIPSYYPNSYDENYGIYFKVQANALHDNGLKIGIISSIIIKHYMLKRSKKLDYGFRDQSDSFPTYIYQIPSFPIIKKVNDYCRLYFGKKLFKKYIKEHGIPDLIHLQSFENGILTRWIKEKYGIPFIVTEHSSGFHRNIYSSWQMKLAQRAFNESRQVYTVSNFLKNTLEKMFSVKSDVLPNMINTDEFTILNEKKVYDFIAVGNLLPAKNYELLIESISIIKKHYPEIKLIIVGEGYLRNDIQKLIDTKNLNENIRLLGSKSQKEVIKLLNQSNIYLSSSHIETFGVSIIEAMSCGLPVISTKSGGPEDTIINEELGQLTDHDPISYANVINYCYENYLSFDAQKIRNYVVDNYSTKAVVNRYKAIYKNFK